jgi:Oxygenase, catalysing oxidative methylation of damaged DNA
MNTLSAEQVTTTKSEVIPADEAVARVNALDWRLIDKDLDEQGSALLPGVLSARECQVLAALYPNDSLFRSRVVMGQHGFGRGEYKYFSYPLPNLIQGLRTALYPRLAPIANRWNAAMEIDVRYPENHQDFLRRCHDAGSSGRRLCSSITARATSTACIRIFMGSTSSRSRWQSCFLSRREISPAANSCSPSNGLVCNHGQR